MSASRIELLPAEWMAPTEGCERAYTLNPTRHKHFVSTFGGSRVASVVCHVELPLTDGFMEEVDALRELIFTKPNVDTRVQSDGNAALTVGLCSNWDIDWRHPTFSCPSTYREDGRPFQAVSVAHNVRVPTISAGDAYLKAVDRYCWGTIEQEGQEYTFDPDVHRATIVGTYMDMDVSSAIVEPARGVLSDERSLPNKYLLGQVANTQIVEDPYAVTLSLLARIAEG